MPTPQQDAAALTSHQSFTPWPLWLLPAWLNASEADRLLDACDQQLQWERPSITLYGKQYQIPRSQVWMGDPQSSYRYSGTDFQPVPWNARLLEICHRLNAIQQQVAHLQGWPAPPSLNSVLLNRYQDGQQKMGFHSDNEPELGPNPVIWSLSLGAARDMRFKPAKGVTGDPFNVQLSHGSLLLMGPNAQRLLQHGIPARSRGNLRINLTFRAILGASSTPG